MSSSIDTELAALHARIAQLEEAKKVPPPVITPQELLVEAQKRVRNNQSSKNKSPISIACRYSYESQTEMLESIVESLNRIHARLDALENR
jgi:exonuclease VII small subunit